MGTEIQVTPVESQVPVRPESVSVAQLWESFLKDQDPERVSEGSRKTYNRSFRAFLLYLEETGYQLLLEQGIETGQLLFTREHVLEYTESLRASSKSSSTRAAYLTVVRRFFEWLELQREPRTGKVLYPNVAKGIKGPKTPKTYLKDALTGEQKKDLIELLATKLNSGRLDAVRDYAVVLLMLGTGMRLISVVRANIEDLSQASGRPILKYQAKGSDSKDDVAVLRHEVHKAITDYLRLRSPHLDPEEPLFVSHSDRNRGHRLSTRTLSRLVKENLRKAGYDLKTLTAHSLRHTAATEAVANGAPVQAVQAMLGHSDISMTMRYVELRDRLEKPAEDYISLEA